MPFAFSDREAAVRVGLRELLQWRELDRRRADAARETRADKHRSRDLETGFGGHGAPIHEADRRLDGSDLEPILLEYGARSALAECLDRLQRSWAPDDWHPGRLVLTTKGMARLTGALFSAVRIHSSLRAGVGSKRLGSIDSIWVVHARMWLADHEIGWIITAGDWTDAAHDHAGIVRRPTEMKQALVEAIEATRPVELPVMRDDTVEFAILALELEVSPERARQIYRSALEKRRVNITGSTARTSDAYARVAARRWQALKVRGFQDTRT